MTTPKAQDDAAEIPGCDDAIVLALAGILDAGMTADQAIELMEFLDSIRQEAQEKGRQAGLEEAAQTHVYAEMALRQTHSLVGHPHKTGRLKEACWHEAAATVIRALKDKPEGGQ